MALLSVSPSSSSLLSVLVGPNEVSQTSSPTKRIEIADYPLPFLGTHLIQGRVFVQNPLLLFGNVYDHCVARILMLITSVDAVYEDGTSDSPCCGTDGDLLEVRSEG